MRNKPPDFNVRETLAFKKVIVTRVKHRLENIKYELLKSM
jgi:hypothetical protein